MVRVVGLLLRRIFVVERVLVWLVGGDAGRSGRKGGGGSVGFGKSVAGGGGDGDWVVEEGSEEVLTEGDALEGGRKTRQYRIFKSASSEAEERGCDAPRRL